jgi:hypothetical protein
MNRPKNNALYCVKRKTARHSIRQLIRALYHKISMAQLQCSETHNQIKITRVTEFAHTPQWLGPH